MAGRRAAAALLLLATAAALSAAAPAAAGGQPHLPCRRRLAQLGFPKPDSCSELSENDFASAFTSLDASCPQAEPWSCEGACFDGMHTLNYKCARAAAIAAAQLSGLDVEAAADRISSLFRTCPDAILEHDDAADLAWPLSPPPPSPASPSPSPMIDPSLSPSPYVDPSVSPSPFVDPMASPSPALPDPSAVPAVVQPSPSPVPVETFVPQPQNPTPVVPVVPVSFPPPPPPPPPPRKSPPPPPPRLAPPPPKVIPGGPNCPYNCCKYDWPPCSFYQ